MPDLPMELPTSYDFGRSKVLLAQGTLGQEVSRDYPQVSLIDERDRIMFNARIDAEASLIYLTSSLKVNSYK